MRCSKVEKLIPQYIDGRLNMRLAREVRAHVDTCAHCRAEEEALRAVLGMLGDWRPVKPERGFDDLARRLERVTSGQPVSSGAAVRRVPAWAAATVAVLGIGLGTTLGVVTSEPPSASLPTEQQVVSAVGLHSFDDSVQASLIYGMEADEAGSEVKQQ